MFEYTIQEKNEVLEKYFESGDKLVLKIFPKKQKQKYLCLLWLMTLFEKDRFYNEKEINQILQDVYVDYVMVRRYLIDFGLVHRKKDGSLYWLS
ncbi:MAG: DUF2087 domain-containing protein [Candidatus Izemoplasmatales bacterium]